MQKNNFILFSLICLLILSLNVFITYAMVSNLFIDLEERKHRIDEAFHLQEFLSNVKDAETGYRGYIITMNEEYLEPYKNAIKYFDSEQIKKFFKNELKHADTSSAIELIEIQELAHQKLHEIQKVINTRNNEGFEAARQLILTKKGKQLMDEIRWMIGSILEKKKQEMEQMDKDNQRSMQNTIIFLIIGNSVGAIVLGICLWSIYTAGQQLQAQGQELSMALQKLNENFSVKEGILNSSNYAIISANPDGIITTFNPAAERLLGYKKEELIGLHTPGIFHDPKEMEARALVLSTQLKRKVVPGFESFVALAREGIADSNEWTYIRKDGTRLPVLLCVTANKNLNGEIIGFLGIAYDITERKEINRMKNELIAITSHEIRAPIVAIKGTLDLLSQSEFSLNSEAKKVVELGQKNCKRLVRLTEDILDIQKIETGKVPFNFKAVNISSFLSQAFPSFQFAAQQAHISLIYTPVPERWNIKADEDRLMQVMHNLLSNAINSSSAGNSVEIEVRKVDAKARFEIKDHGKGIDKDVQEKISEQIASQNYFAMNDRKGAGLGLSIAKAIIEKHNGALKFQTGSHGTTFWFELPLEEA